MNKKKRTAAPEPRKRGRRPVAGISAPQRRAFTAIRNHLAYRGFPPTVQELGELLGLGPSSAHELVNQLVRKGYLRRDAGKARSLEIARQLELGVADLVPVPIAGRLAVPRGTAVMTTSRKNEEPRMTKPPRQKATSVPREKASAVSRLSKPLGAGRLEAQGVGPLLERVVSILEAARGQVVRSVNNTMVLAYWQIGREIVEYYQAGAVRAEYGDQLLDLLSAQLRERVGRGYSTTNLRYFRAFYLAYANRSPEIRHIQSGESRAVPATVSKRGAPKIRHTARGVLQDLEVAIGQQTPLDAFSPLLGWSHYRQLMKVEHEPARRFYEIEAERAEWSVQHLERQIDTQLFLRLLKSRDKAGVMDLATRGQVLEHPVDAIKHPFVLDFLDLPESEKLRESDLERAILEKLQHFLLELGKGFAFVARQKRLSFEDEYFYVDLVFYNVILKCYLLIDLKLGKLAHQDVGQMDSYVRLFDAQGRTEGDGPTIGLILCAEKNEAVARYSVLHENEQLFAAKYVTYLPSVEELERELAREKRLIEANAEAAVAPRKKRTPAPSRGRGPRSSR